jgi:hypothetical protein
MNKQNYPNISKQDFQKHNQVVAGTTHRPSPKYPKSPTGLYILSYVATRELENIKDNKNFDQTKPSSFTSVPKR